MDASITVSNTIWDMLGAISMAIAATVIIIGFCYARRQLASTRNARIAQIIMEVTARWDSKAMEESRCLLNQQGDAVGVHAAIKKADNDNEPNLCTLTRPANFFDALGVLVTEGFVDCSIAWDVFGQAEEHYYKLYSKTFKDPKYKEYVNCFQELHEAFKKETTRRKQPKPRRWPRRRP